MDDEELALSLYKIYLGLETSETELISQMHSKVRFYTEDVKAKWIRIAKTIKENYLELFVMGGT